MALIKQKCQALAEFLELGRSWNDLSLPLRNFSIGDCLIFYRLGTRSAIEIIAVVSGYRALEALLTQ